MLLMILLKRGVKLTADFLGAARKEENLQNILQTVEVNRLKMASLKAKKDKIMSWSLAFDA